MIAQMSVRIILALSIGLQKKEFFFFHKLLKSLNALNHLYQIQYIRVLELVDRENLSFSDSMS